MDEFNIDQIIHYPANICITFVQCWPNVEDVGTTLYKCYANVCWIVDDLIDIKLHAIT